MEWEPTRLCGCRQRLFAYTHLNVYSVTLMIDPKAELKKALGDSLQVEFARKIGISQQYLNDMLQGHRRVGSSVLDYLGLERIEIVRRKRKNGSAS